MKEDKYKLVLEKQTPEMGEGTTISAEWKTPMNLKQISEILGKQEEQEFIEIRIIKL